MLFVVTLFLAGLLVAHAEDQKYTTQYDNIDLKDLVTNERLLRNYVHCLLDKGPCTPDGMELKNDMPDAIQSDCSKCTEKQQEGSKYIIRYLIDNKPEYWNQLQAKYDPTETYKKRYMLEIENDTKKDETKDN